MPGPMIQDFRFIYHKEGRHDVYFEAANQDLTDSTYQFFGFISSGGSWLIQRFHIIASAVIYKYAAGQTRTDYDACWDATGIYVGTLAFDTFDQIALSPT